MQETLTWFKLLFLEEKMDRGILYLMALLSGLKYEEISVALERLSPPPKAKDLIIRSISEARDLVKKLPISDPVEVYKLLNNLKLETVLFVMAFSKDRKKQKVISLYLTELRNVKTILKGEDLKRMGINPGPVYSKILKKLLEEKLRGRLKSRGDERKFVKSLIE
jgi:tRNA nucleotidyltransferase (CCA-adding enzyme)